MKSVPTCAELAKMGRHLCYEVSVTVGSGRKKRTDRKWHITIEGHALLGEVMRENALENIADGVGNWVQPPSRKLGYGLVPASDEAPAEVRQVQLEREVEPLASWSQAGVPLRPSS